jgi:maltodextrin utilization protein YvdJ
MAMNTSRPKGVQSRPVPSVLIHLRACINIFAVGLFAAFTCFITKISFFIWIRSFLFIGLNFRAGLRVLAAGA